MKKSLIALGVLGAISVAAYAESQVTLYGILEEGVVVQKQSHRAAQVELASGFDQGSRWGIRGTEDMGNGNWVGFILEQGINVDDGTVASNSYGTSGGFTRESIINAGGDWGSFPKCRTAALSFPQSRAILSGWMFGTSWQMGAWNNYVVSTSRINNSISYQTPDMGGFKISLMYGNGIGTDTEQWSHNTHYYGAGVIYQANNIKSSLIYENIDWKGTHGNPQYNTSGSYPYRGDQNEINFGFEYDFGDWTAGFAYEWSHIKDGQQTNMFGLNAKVGVGGGDFLIGARYIFGKDTTYMTKHDYGENKISTWQIDLAYTYPFSKRTALKLFAGYTGSSKLWKNREWLDNYYDGGAVGTGAVFNGFQLYAGLRHSF